MGRTRPAIHGRSTDRCLPPATAWCDEYERWREYMVISPRLCDIAAGSGDLPQSQNVAWGQHKVLRKDNGVGVENARSRSEEHTSELQSRGHLVCRLLL